MAAQLDDLRKNFAIASMNLNTALKKGLNTGALIVERDYKVRLTRGGQVASGLLRASAAHRVIDKSITGGYLVGQVGSNVEYAKEVELGGPPRHVPFGDILEWVKRKHLVSGSGKGGRKTRGDKYDEFDVALLIQRSIAEKGTMPHPALLPALLSNKAAIFAAIRSPMQAELRKGRVSGAS